MLERLKYINDSKITSILKDSNVIKFRTKDEIKKLIEIYVKSNRNEVVYKLITNIDLLSNRINDEQIALITKFVHSVDIITYDTREILRNRVKLYMGEDKYNKYIENKKNEIFKIITKTSILKLKTLEEQTELIDWYVKTKDLSLHNARLYYLENFSYDIITNENILNNLNHLEHISFLNHYSFLPNNELSKKMKELLDNTNLFKNRTFMEIHTMLSLCHNEDFEDIYPLIIDDTLLNKSYEEQIKLINELNNLESSSNRKKINHLKDMKEMLEPFKIDIKMETPNRYKK